MTVGRICSRVVASASSHEMIRTAADRMAATDVGMLIVLEPTDDAKPIGVVTDRDLVTRCMATHLDPDLTEVGTVMTHPLHCVDEHTPVEEALERMAKAGVRRLVVLGDSGRLVGVLSVDDAFEALAGAVASIRGVLAKQREQMPQGFALR